MKVYKIIMDGADIAFSISAFVNAFKYVNGGAPIYELIAGISFLISGILVLIDRKQRIENDEELSRYHITFAASILMGIGLIIHYLLEKIF